MDPTFAIRRCKDVEEASYYFLKWPVQEGWNHSTDDAEVRHVFYPCDPNGFFVGTVKDKDNGQEIPIGMILALKHTADLAWIGCFIVAEQYRGSGYGRRIFQHAMDYLEGTRYIGLDAKLEKVGSYELAGFKLTGGWTGKTYRGNIVEDVLKKLGSVEDYDDVKVADWDEEQEQKGDALEQLALLDQKHSGYYRPNFWTRWMELHTTTIAGYKAKDYGRYAIKVLDAEGTVAHFATIRPAVKGFVITLISGSTHVAEAMLRHMAQWIIDAASTSTWRLPKDHRMVINGNGCAINQACMDLYQGLGFEWVSTRERMFLHGVHPSTDPSGLYSIASLTVG